jgi:hypothetical protein
MCSIRDPVRAPAPAPITVEVLQAFLADPAAGGPSYTRKHHAVFEKTLTEVVQPLLKPWTGPDDIDTNPDRLSVLAPPVLEWLYAVLPAAIKKPFDRHDRTPEGTPREDTPYWLLQLTRAVLQWHISKTPVHPVFGNPSDVLRADKTVHAMWFRLPLAIAAAAPAPALLRHHEIFDAMFRFYDDDVPSVAPTATPPWVEDFGAPSVRSSFLSYFQEIVSQRGGFSVLLQPRVRSHTCRLLSRLIVQVGAHGECELAEVDGDSGLLACKVLTAGLAMLAADDPARDATVQALALLTPASAAPAAAAGSLKRAREE